MKLNVLKNIAEGALDLVYPPFCVTCGAAADDYLCPECISRIVFIEQPYCSRCGAPRAAASCAACRGQDFCFDSAHCAGIYEGVLREAIHALKYSFHEAVAHPLGRIMVERFPVSFLGGRIDCVLPLPIHPSRMLARGFNQSELIAKRLCADAGLTLEPRVLYQRHKTRHQMSLPQERRWGNVRNAFGIRNPHIVAGKRVLLIDDVLTTGATVNEAAAALRGAGASSVHVFTLARSI